MFADEVPRVSDLQPRRTARPAGRAGAGRVIQRAVGPWRRPSRCGASALAGSPRVCVGEVPDFGNATRRLEERLDIELQLGRHRVVIASSKLWRSPFRERYAVADGCVYLADLQAMQAQLQRRRILVRTRRDPGRAAAARARSLRRTPPSSDRAGNDTRSGDGVRSGPES